MLSKTTGRSIDSIPGDSYTMSLLTAMFLSLAITTTTVLLLLTPAAATALQVMMQLRRPSGGCFPGEMDALLEFKEGIANDTTGLLASWRPEDGQDCCRWTGVRCSNRTGHILKLNLRSSINPFAMRLFGEISHSAFSSPSSAPRSQPQLATRAYRRYAGVSGLSEKLEIS